MSPKLCELLELTKHRSLLLQTVRPHMFYFIMHQKLSIKHLYNFFANIMILSFQERPYIDIDTKHSSIKKIKGNLISNHQQSLFASCSIKQFTSP